MENRKKIPKTRKRTKNLTLETEGFSENFLKDYGSIEKFFKDSGFFVGFPKRLRKDGDKDSVHFTTEDADISVNMDLDEAIGLEKPFRSTRNKILIHMTEEELEKKILKLVQDNFEVRPKE